MEVTFLQKDYYWFIKVSSLVRWWLYSMVVSSSNGLFFFLVNKKICKGVRSYWKKSFWIHRQQSIRTGDTSMQEDKRQGQDGTWITPEVEKAYCQNAELRMCPQRWSMEGWRTGGWLYMELNWERFFWRKACSDHQSNASRYAFIKYVELLKEEGVQIIDRQVYTEYLESLGARMIDREICQAPEKYMPIIVLNIEDVIFNSISKILSRGNEAASPSRYSSHGHPVPTHPVHTRCLYHKSIFANLPLAAGSS